MTNCSKLTYLATHHQLFESVPKTDRQCGFKLRWISGKVQGLTGGIVLVFHYSTWSFFISSLGELTKTIVQLESAVSEIVCI